jgi:hypothetical protein
MRGWFVAAFVVVGGQACGAQVEGAGDAPGTLSYANHPQQVVSGDVLNPAASVVGDGSDLTHSQGAPAAVAVTQAGAAVDSSSHAAERAVSPSIFVAPSASALPAEPQRLEVGASQLAKDDCRVWLDVAESEIAPGDLSVKFGEEVWPSVDACSEQPGWTLLHDAEGVWLQLCAFSCQLVTLAPSGVLAIESTYRTQPLHQAR